jgi:hypothetical protein
MQKITPFLWFDNQAQRHLSELVYIGTGLGWRGWCRPQRGLGLFFLSGSPGAEALGSCRPQPWLFQSR